MTAVDLMSIAKHVDADSLWHMRHRSQDPKGIWATGCELALSQLFDLMGIKSNNPTPTCADCGKKIPAGQSLCNCNTSGDLG